MTTDGFDKAAAEAGRRGRTLLITGDGKGKTTSALGMVLRASGHGIRTLVVQFIKSDASTGEIAGCGYLPGVELIQTGRGFIPSQQSPRFADHCEAAQQGMTLARDAVVSGSYGLVVLDEICTAVAKGLLSEDDVVDVVTSDRESCVVLTGRGATDRLISLADTVSVVQCARHGYADGWPAQRGIEF